jgi:hypothetical protein
MRTNLFRSSRFVLLFGLLALAASGVAGVHFNREAGTARDIASKLNIGNHTAGIARIDMSLVRAYKTWRDLKNDAKYVVVATAGAQQTQVATKNLPWTTTTMNIDQVVVSKDGTKPTALLVRQLVVLHG